MLHLYGSRYLWKISQDGYSTSMWELQVYMTPRAGAILVVFALFIGIGLFMVGYIIDYETHNTNFTFSLVFGVIGIGLGTFIGYRRAYMYEMMEYIKVSTRVTQADIIEDLIKKEEKNGRFDSR